jgi:hypothetical protein
VSLNAATIDALTVASETTLAVNVSLISDYNYNVSGYLLSSADPVIGKTLQIYVNNTLKANVTTGDPHGNFNLTLNLPSVNDQPTTYNIQASFQGDNPSNATAYGYTPNGTQYAVCTTTQYGYKPSSNCTVLTVEPQAAQAITAAKTMDQMQKEADSSGWFRVDTEWSWWYPWFRLHYKLDVNLPQGNPKLDYGWSPLPFGDSCSADNVVLANMLDDASTVSGPDMVQDYLVGVIIQFGLALWLGCTPMTAAIAIAVYAAYSISSSILLYEASGGNPRAWLVASIASAIDATAGFVLSGLDSVRSFLTSVWRLILGKIQSVWYSCVARGLGFFTIVGFAFALMDFVFAAVYLGMYLSST